MMRYFFRFLILLSLFGSQSSIASEKQSLTADEIISKHLAAAGGKRVLAGFKSRIAIGTVNKENEPEGRMAIMSESPNRVSAVYVFEKYDWQLTFDGKNAFIRGVPFPRDFSPLQNKYQQMLASGVMFNSISLYNVLLDSEAYGATFEAKGMKKIKDRMAYVVEMKRPKTETARLYFDADNFMWIRTDYGSARVSKPMGEFTNQTVTHGDDEFTVDFYFETSDFREVDGVKLPFKFQQVITTPVLRQKKAGPISGTITQYQHNVLIDPKMFQ